MKLSDALALPVEVGAAIRHRRLFHPSGVLVAGSLERIAALGDGLPVVSGPVTGRISKGIGLSGAVPDVAGLAWKMPPQRPGDPPWDVLLASTGGGWSRILLRPAISWAGATFSSLMPLGHDGGVWWITARLTTELGTPGLSLDTITDQLARGPLEFDIEQAAGTGAFRPLARLSLREVLPADPDVAFDPTVNSAPDVQLLPRWLTGFRRAAYRRSREGRGAE